MNYVLGGDYEGGHYSLVNYVPGRDNEGGHYPLVNYVLRGTLFTSELCPGGGGQFSLRGDIIH